jgi:hypothetical protein
MKNILICIIFLLLLLIIILILKKYKSKKNIFQISQAQKIFKYNQDIYIVDNFFKNPHKIRSHALEKFSNFLDHNSIYFTKYFNPNIKYDRHQDLVRCLEKILNIDINEEIWNRGIYKGSNGYIQYSTYKDDPSVIHADEGNWTVIVFLSVNPKKECGTSFFKHKKYNLNKTISIKNYSKKTKIPKQRSKKILEEIENNLWTHESVPQREKWENLLQIENKFNRALIFNGDLFHCSNCGFGNNKKTFRLFQTFFIERPKT